MRDTIELAHEAGLIKTVDCCGVPDKFCGQDEWKGNLKTFEALVRADEREKAKHNEEVLMNALWKACGDDGQMVVETIESQGELK
jgi:hypothetical protein